jgi:hypothetical protein
MRLGSEERSASESGPYKNKNEPSAGGALQKNAACATDYLAAPTTGAAAKCFNDSV